MFILFDSRARVRTGRRKAYRYEETPEGVFAVWHRVLHVEVPDEYGDYIGFAYTPVCDAQEVFNDYWACYGWYLGAFEEDADCPEDVDMQN